MNRIGAIFFLTHGFFVLTFGFVVGFLLRSSSEFGMLWGLWWVLDFPVSILAVRFERYMGGFPFEGFGDMASSLIFAIFFAIFGGVQYYVIGVVLSKTVLRH